MGVASMYEHPDLQVEAVHLAIALAYYGLLRVPPRSEASDIDICEFMKFHPDLKSLMTEIIQTHIARKVGPL